MNRREFHGAVAAALAGGIAVRGALGDAVAAATARRPDPSTADHLAGLNRYLDEMSDVRPISSLLAMSESLAALAESCLREAPEGLQAEIGRATADAALTHWWFLRNCGREGEAVAVQGQVMELAAAWDVPETVGAMLARLADGSADHRRRLQLASAALGPHHRLPAEGRFEAAWSQVDAHILGGDNGALPGALERAQAAHAKVVPTRERPLVLAPLSKMDADHLRLSGLVLQLFDEGPGAAPALEAALGEFPAERVRDVMYFRAVLATMRALTGDLDGAERDAEAAAQLAREDGSLLPLTSGGLTAVATRPGFTPLRTVLADHGLLTA